jgi:hypothetical protein
MWKRLADYLSRVLFLARQTEENTREIAKLKEQLTDLTRSVTQLSNEFRTFKETDRLEREKMALQLENAFLRFERRLEDKKPKE